MSWDVVLFNFRGEKPPPFDSMGEDFKPPPMGKADEVRRIISTHLPEVDWSDPTQGIFDGDGYSIEFCMIEGETINGMTLFVRGGGDPITAIMKFCKPAGWSALDTSTDQWLDPDNPSHEGWEGFQRYRDRVIGASAPPIECPECKRKFPPHGASCLFCGWSALTGLKPSPDLHPAAPGRPEKEIVSDVMASVRRWLWVSIPTGILIAILIIWLKPRDETERRLDAMRVLMLTQGYVKNTLKDGRVLPDGRVEAGPDWSHPEFVLKAADGKSYICDPWKNPVRVTRGSTGLWICSFGPNGKDDSGQGDDIVFDTPDQ